MPKGWKLPAHNETSALRPSPGRVVALAYDPSITEAPRVIASGQGQIAERIMAIAESNGITIHKDADLLELLASVEVNSTIPVEAFAVVAEILSYVYRTTERLPPSPPSSAKEPVS